jgi:phosphoribosylamine--glycine ligase
MAGEEVSYFALTDGTNIIPLTSAQDHKRAFDNDTGPNTGGMGAYSPAPIFTRELEDYTNKHIIQPTIDAMRQEGRTFIGILFAGLMIVDGVPKLLEYNVRFGDPECQAIMRRMNSDLVELLYAIATESKEIPAPVFSDQTSLCVVLASKGYPAEFQKLTEIKNIKLAQESNPSTEIFHAGTIKDGDRILSNGGRVLGMTSIADNAQTARDLAYKAVDLIDWPMGFCRRDIAHRALALGQKKI